MADLTYLKSDLNYLKLERTVLDGDCVAFVGSGLSAHIYPTWTDLVIDLCEHCGISLNSDARMAVGSKGEVLPKLAGVAKAFDKRGYTRVLEKHFTEIEPKIREDHKLLVSLPFQGFLTLNYDTLLEIALQAKEKKPESKRPPALDFGNLRKHVVYHLHGYIDPTAILDIDSLVVSDDDFQRFYGSNDSLLGPFLGQAFSFRNILFVGCRLSEPEIELILRRTKNIRDSLALQNEPPGQLFILLPMLYRRNEHGVLKRDRPTEIADEVSYQGFGISVVRYKNMNDDHSHLSEILRAWVRELSPETVIESGEVPEIPS